MIWPTGPVAPPIGQLQPLQPPRSVHSTARARRQGIWTRRENGWNGAATLAGDRNKRTRPRDDPGGYHGGMPKRILLAWPRGYCAGVERAIDTVERALRIYGPPVYVRKQIVHNIHVVRDLESKGAVFVEDERDVPEGGVC